MTQIARHPQRPYTLDYVDEIFTEFQELHGDRPSPTTSRSSAAWRASTARPAWCSATRRAATPRSAGCATSACRRPEGYRKALRLMKLAEKFGLPLFTFVDTPGAYPGIGAEERGQSEAIGRNIFEMAQLEVPIIITIIGEGGSGGALAHQRGRPGADAAVLGVLGDLARGLRVDPVEDRRARLRRCRGAGHHRAPAEGAGPDRQDRQRAGRRRAPRHPSDGRVSSSARSATRCARWATSSPRNCCSGATSGCSPTAASATPRSVMRPADVAARRCRSRWPSSGGRDSTALLHAPRARRQPLRLEVVALHVHHGLMPDGRWLAGAGAGNADAGARWPAVAFRCSALAGARRAATASRPGPAATATARWPRWRARPAWASCCWRTIGATRPKPCCCRRCAAPAPPGWPRCRSQVERDGIAWARPWLDHAARSHRCLCAPAPPALRRRREQHRPALRAQPPARGSVAGLAARPSRRPRRTLAARRHARRSAACADRSGAGRSDAACATARHCA